MTEDHPSHDIKAYVDGTLPAAEALALEEHLSGCPECRAELTAVRALADPSTAELSELESAGLRKAVWEALKDEEREQPRSRTWGRRISPLLGAAALVAVVAVGAAQVLGGAGGNESSSRSTVKEENGGVADPAEPKGGKAKGTETMGTSDGDADQERGERTDGGGESPDRGQGPTAVSSDSVAASAGAAPKPVFVSDGQPVSRDDLLRLAARRPPFTSFSLSYRTVEADKLQPRFTANLARRAGDRDADQLTACVNSAYRAAAPGRLLPAYARVGELDGTDSLVVGFVWAARDEKSLRRFQLWAWPRGDCSSTLLLERGRIRR